MHHCRIITHKCEACVGNQAFSNYQFLSSQAFSSLSAKHEGRWSLGSWSTINSPVAFNHCEQGKKDYSYTIQPHSQWRMRNGVRSIQYPIGHSMVGVQACHGSWCSTSRTAFMPFLCFWTMCLDQKCNLDL